MHCNDFEDRLEALVDGSLVPAERRACEAHVAGCAACGELYALASLEPAPAAAVDEIWLDEVMARTSGSACAETEAAFGDRMGRELPAGDRERFENHLGGCADCAALASTLAALAIELPRMAEIRPDGRFVEDVLARSLPVPVRLRRFWARTWPRWVRRPRFASEAAYVGLLVLVLVFGTAGSPLEAVPRKALEAVQEAPRGGITLPVAAVEGRLEGKLEELRTGSAGRRAAGWYRQGEEVLARARAGAGSLENRAELAWGTLRDGIASWMENAEGSAPEPSTTNEERP